jgi:hypothetical protein
MAMKWFLIVAVACAVAFYIRFLWAIQNDLQQWSKNRTDSGQPSPCRSLLEVNITDILAQTPVNAARASCDLPRPQA